MTETIERGVRRPPKRPNAPTAIGQARPLNEKRPRVDPTVVNEFLAHLNSHPLPDLPIPENTPQKK